VGYSSRPDLRSHSEAFIGFERFHHYTGIDYVFAPPPLPFP